MADFVLSNEQVEIIEAALDPEIALVKVEAVAGAAKSTTLHEVTKALPSTSYNQYLAYNKTIELEAKEKFAKNTICKTTAAFAFAEIVTKGTTMPPMEGQPPVKPGRRELNPNHCYKDILGLSYRQYDEKLLVIDAMTKFFASDCLSVNDFFIQYPDPAYSNLIQLVTKKNIKAMADKKIPCSFGFSLKYYHILLARGVIKITKPYDLLMIDEFQDSQPVVLEIFKLLPAHKKIAVGDSDQSINGSFLHTTDAFSAISEYGVTKHLTKSFRCSEAIAKRVERYGQKNFRKSFQFKGLAYEEERDNSIGFISKTNSSLIAKMVECEDRGITYKNKRDPKLIFKLAMTLIHLKPGCQIHDSSLKYLIDDMEEYYSHPALQFKYSNLLAYIMAQHQDDRILKGTIALISKHGGKKLRETYNRALAYYKDRHLQTNLWLTTAHSSKGLTFGTVEVGEDLNTAILEIALKNTEDRTFEEREVMMIGYVVATRARHNLVNCKYL